MTYQIRQLVVGELAAPLSVVLLNRGVHPSLGFEQVKPYGYDEAITWSDGSVGPGVRQPVPVWLISGHGRHILVDTGFDSPAEVLAACANYGYAAYARRTPEQELPAQLACAGLQPEDIDLVVLTHTHFDHIGGTGLFPNATFVVQRDEIPFCLAPPKFGLFYYQEYARHLLAVLDRVKPVEGDLELVPGIHLAKLGGHSPGSMAVIVETSQGRVAIAGDIVYDSKNLELEWPIGAYYRMDQLLAGMQRLRLLATKVLPNHCWKLCEEYPDGVIG